MPKGSPRRDFMKQAGLAGLAMGIAGTGAQAARRDEEDENQETEAEVSGKRQYEISLAAWSLHKSIGTGEGKIPMLDMPRLAREEFGIDAIELVSTMLASTEDAYLDQLAKNAADHDIKMLLIMIDNEGSIGAESENMRQAAVENHKKWMDIAARFGCHSIRMNWAGAPHGVEKDPEALKAFTDRSVPGFRALCEYGDTIDINVMIENHGGASSDPDSLIALMKACDHGRFGTLPDFGNFPEGVDIYDAIDRIMPYAKAVSAKCYDFDDTTGLETKIDFERMIQIVHDKHQYHGRIGIEFEGDRLSEFDGIKAAKKLLVTLQG